MSINPDARIVDINHEIPPQDIKVGAFILLNTLPYFPTAVHIAVIDPGVGSQRRPIIIESDHGFLVGPDNGLLVPIANKLDMKRVIEITNPKYLLPDISTTFHARDIFAPVGAHLSKGTAPTNIGEVVDRTTLVDLEFPEPTFQHDHIEGEIIFIDPFGNCITNIPMDQVMKRFEFQQAIRCTIEGEEHLFRYLPSYSYASEHELILVSSSFNLLEVASNQDNAQKHLGCQIGSKITIGFEIGS